MAHRAGSSSLAQCESVSVVSRWQPSTSARSPTRVSAEQLPGNTRSCFSKENLKRLFKSEEERKTVDFSRGAPVTRPDACSAVRLGQCRETAQSAASLT